MRASQYILFGLLAILISRTALGDEPSKESTRVAWLKSHTAPLRSIDPADEDFSDLEPIRRAIGDARIVQIGEQSHGDGATFHARTRIIKYLHEKCGFDVLAFESGLYDCHKAWEFLRAGNMAPREAVSHGVFGIWTSSEQIQPLIHYLATQANTDHPLEICGFDCQFTADSSARYLPDDLSAFLNKLSLEIISSEQKAHVVRACRRMARIGEGINPDEAEAIESCRKAIAAVPPSKETRAEELVFWRQFLASAAALAKAQPAFKTPPANEDESYGNIRDRQMAKNLVWLAQSVYPKRKIIVWAAAFHLLRNQQQLAMIVDPGKSAGERKTISPYLKTATMGDEAYKTLGKETYNLFFTAGEGEFGSIRVASPQKLPSPLPGSIEDLFLKAGCENAFLDIRGRDQNGDWLTERLVARMLGYANIDGDWSRVCDGIIFTRKMYPSTLAKIGPKDAPYQPLFDAAVRGTEFDRYTTRDSFGRTITFYLSHLPKDAKESLPIAVFVQGSGCSSVFRVQDGKTYGGLQNIVLAAAHDKMRVLIVEKPGVNFGDRPKNPGAAEEGSPEFRREHILPRWVEALNAAVLAAYRLPNLDCSRTLAAGHSEGGIVVAHLAAKNPCITHVGILAGGGPTQLFELAELARQRRQPGEPEAVAVERSQRIYDGWAKVLTDPDSADKLWLGHPYRRWTSFLKTSPLEGLLASRATVFLAQGTDDKAVPVSSMDLLRAELIAKQRDITFERLEGYDHSFRKAGEATNNIDGLQSLFGRMLDWFSTKSLPLRQTADQQLGALQGDWDVTLLAQSGRSQPSKGMEVTITDDQRMVKSGERILSQSTIRLIPDVKPMAIEVTVSATGKILHGIIEVDGDTQRVCLAAEGGDRPAEFTSTLDDGCTFTVLKRKPHRQPAKPIDSPSSENKSKKP